MFRIVLISILVCLFTPAASPALAQNVQALINKALDEQVKLNLDTTVPQAMAAISQQTGVRIKEDPMIWDLLPWGRDTAVKAKVENKTLREALVAITRKLGLVMILRDEFIEIAPLPALRRLGQRANREELDALDLLAGKQLGLDTDQPTVKRLLEAVDAKLEQEQQGAFGIENRILDDVKQSQVVYVPRNASLMDALESLHKDTGATWYPWGKFIVIVPKEEATRRRLGKELTIRTGERGMDVLDVLSDVANRTGVFFEYQPGVLQSIPPEARVIRGILDNAPAQQILEAVTAATGLRYAIADEKVIISSPNGAAGGAPPVMPRDPIIAFIELDGGIQLVVTTSKLPEDVKQYLQWKTEKEVARLKEMMKAEGFKPKPPTRPATQPAGQPTGQPGAQPVKDGAPRDL